MNYIILKINRQFLIYKNIQVWFLIGRISYIYTLFFKVCRKEYIQKGGARKMSNRNESKNQNRNQNRNQNKNSFNNFKQEKNQNNSKSEQNYR